MAAAHRDTPALLRKHGYTEIKKVGEGSFGKAILVQGQNGSKLICKMVDVSRASSKEMQDALKEGKVLASLSHPYIVRYRESFTECGWFCILMDFCEAGDLTKQLEQAKRSRTPLKEDQILKWFTQAVLALKYIHDRHILHRDLKPGNFFLSKSGSMKMGDFGIAKVLECTIAVARTQIGTPYYLSPELCQERPYTTPADIWAMGCILYEMCALKVPFDAESIPKLVNAIVRGRIPTVPATYSKCVQQLVADMLNRDPKKRPDCDEILQRPEIQAIVKSMVEEAQEKEGVSLENGTAPKAAPEAKAPAEGPSAPKAAPEVKASLDGPYKQNAGNYKKDDLVEYLSSAHKSWLPAIVIDADADGRIRIDLKPNTWIEKGQQATHVRPREGAARAVLASANRAASPMNRGRAPSPMNRAPSPMRQQSPSPRNNQPWNGNFGRPSSRDGLPGSRGASPMHRSPSGNVGQPLSARSSAGNYKVGDLVEFWSNSHNDWLPAQILNSDATGRIVIDLKPNTWITKDEQGQKVRPRRSAGNDRPSSANRRPQVGGSPQLPRPPLHRSPSWGVGDYRAPSPAGRAGTPLRAPSPSGRAGTPLRAPSPSSRPMTPSRLGTPGRAASPSPKAGYVPGSYQNPRPPRVSQSPLRAGAAAILGQ
jgi:NIMA (never in mitosis gene a)-related kinase